jgi:phosphomethylpyrimidine synthase
MTIHAGLTRKSVERMERSGRALDVVSRGGSMLVYWMRKNGKENLLYEGYDEILSVLKEYDVTISIGDGMRPGALVDATDPAQIDELLTIGELVARARDAGVQAMVEGPGHIPLHQIEANVRLEKSVCDGAPFYVLGPVVVDTFPGYDHIVSAIGGALAAFYGADFLCYVTPAEHLSLPDVNDVVEGVIAAKIAATAADLAKGNSEYWKWQKEMAEARKRLDWDRQIELAHTSERARYYRERSGVKEEYCSMCGEFCAIKTILESEGGV